MMPCLDGSFAGSLYAGLEVPMSVLPSILSAIAAAIAAVLAGLGLYVSGRREHRQWLRNSLVDSYMNYLTASFESGGREVLQARLRGNK
jgi:hypothetical protein